MGSTLVSVIVAIVLGAGSTIIAALFTHLSGMASLMVGAATGIVTFIVGTLGAAKAALEIQHKHLEIRKTKHDLRTLDGRIVVPSVAEIHKFGGVVYRQIETRARLDVNLHERLESRSFIVDLREEKADDQASE
jgi:hypothetical protein